MPRRKYTHSLDRLADIESCGSMRGRYTSQEACLDMTPGTKHKRPSVNDLAESSEQLKGIFQSSRPKRPCIESCSAKISRLAGIILGAGRKQATSRDTDRYSVQTPPYAPHVRSSWRHGWRAQSESSIASAGELPPSAALVHCWCY